MFLQRITLENVRSIEHLDLEFRAASDDGTAKTRRWTYILGENGTGKSTLLRSIALILAGSDALPELLGQPDDWIRLGASAANIRVEIITADGELRTAELTINSGDTIRELYVRNAELLENLDNAFRHTARNYFTVGYGVSRRPSDEKTSVVVGTSTFSNPRARSVATLFSALATLVPLETWAMDLDYRKDGFEVVRQAIDRMLPGVDLADIDRERRELTFESPDGRLPFRLLSEGYQNVAAWTGDLLYQITNIFEDFSDPFSVRGLLLIDEVDLHLHPVWQRRLMEFVSDRFPNLQIVATTHSPLTAHQAGEGELFFLRRPAADAPAQLEAYHGAPRNLMLHQLITTPAFGLSTLDSRPVEAMRQEYRQLRGASSRSVSENTRLKELGDELADLPDWTEGIKGEKRLTDLLTRIDEDLAKRGR